MRGLYAIADVTSLRRLGLDVVKFAQAVCEAPIAALQLRDKNGSSRATLALLRALRTVTQPRGVLLYANDRPDLALLAECDGVHVGQDDLPPSAARRLGVSAVGLSVHDEAQLAAALEQPVDYIAFGPVFATSSKHNPDPVLGLERLQRLVRAAGDRSVVAIGGITRHNARAVAAVCPCIAVIGALLPSVASERPYAEIAKHSHMLSNAICP